MYELKPFIGANSFISAPTIFEFLNANLIIFKVVNIFTIFMALIDLFIGFIYAFIAFLFFIAACLISVPFNIIFAL